MSVRIARLAAPLMLGDARTRRRISRLVAVAAGMALLSGGFYALVVYAGGWMVSTGVQLLSEGLVWVMVSMAEGVDLWALVAQIGGSIGGALATPRGAGVLIALEATAVLALFALHRALRPRGERGESRETRR